MMTRRKHLPIIARPSWIPVLKANAFGFLATGAGLATWSLWTAPAAGLAEYGLGALTAIVTVKLGAKAIAALHIDFRNRRAWARAQRPTTKKHDGRFATHEEMAQAGMFEPKGRLLGMTLDGYLLFEPHKPRPVFSYHLIPQGGGKTTCFSIASTLLSSLLPR